MDIPIEVGDQSYRLQPDTAQVFRFRKLPQADHAYYEDGSIAFYVFNRPDLYDLMEREGGRCITDDFPNDTDLDAYVRHTMSELSDIDDDMKGFYE